MELIAYQLFIFLSLVCVRYIFPRYFVAACLLWTGFTVINLFWPPLIVVQLAVIWGTYLKLQPSDQEQGKTRSQPDATDPVTGSAMQQTRQATANATEVVLTDIDRHVGANGTQQAASATKVHAPPPSETKATHEGQDALQIPRQSQEFNDALSDWLAETPDRAHESANNLAKPAPKNSRMTLGALFGAVTAAANKYSASALQSDETARKVPFLVHFTRLKNVESILNKGILSLEAAGALGINLKCNDRLRLDGRLNGISLSIAFPNYKMFYKYRKEFPSEDWVVLLVQPDVLWLKSCCFCHRNAADHRVRSASTVELMTVWAFHKMFAELDDVPSRAEQNLESYDPTDPQAEVLVLGTIEPKYISGLVFNSQQAAQSLIHLRGSRRWEVHSGSQGLFGTREFSRKPRR